MYYLVEFAFGALKWLNFRFELLNMNHFGCRYRSRALKSRSVLRAAPSFLRLLYYIEM